MRASGRGTRVEWPSVEIDCNQSDLYVVTASRSFLPRKSLHRLRAGCTQSLALQMGPVTALRPTMADPNAVVLVLDNVYTH